MEDAAMRFSGILAVALALAAGPALAQGTDANMSCADYLKAAAAMGPTPSSGDAATDKAAAEMDAKMKAYCTANPTVPFADAATKIMSGQ
jgi:hypothetical protein